MNKMMKTAAAVMACGIAATASAASVDKCETVADAKAYVAQLMPVAETNFPAARNDLGRAVSRLRDFCNRQTGDGKRELAAFCADLDARLAAFPEAAAVGNWEFASYADDPFPKVDAMSLARSGNEDAAPVMLAVARAHGCQAAHHVVNSVATLDELIGLVNECVSLADGKPRNTYQYGVYKQYAAALQKAVQRKVRAYLRKQGKSFVTKDGVNPCEALMVELNAALNAPYLKGVNEWLEKVGIAGRIDVSKLPTEKEAAQLKADILDGETDMSRDHEFVLKLCLGVDGYNSFVKDYNGEK